MTMSPFFIDGHWLEKNLKLEASFAPEALRSIIKLPKAHPNDPHYDPHNVSRIHFT
jgi:hypothetical protein